MVDHAELKSAILAASLELGTELGDNGLTMRGIARRLGVSATTLYQHFDGKQAILAAIRYRGIEQLYRHLQPAFEAADPLEQLRRHAVRYLQFARENPWVYMVLTEAPGDQANIDQSTRETALKSMEAVHNALRAAKKRGQLGGDVDLEYAPMLMWAALHGMALFMEAGRVRPDHPLFPSLEEDQSIQGFADHVVSSFVAP